MICFMKRRIKIGKGIEVDKQEPTYKLFGKYINEDGVYVLNGRKYQFIKEIKTWKHHDIHCVYKNTKILNNRYADYDNMNHKYESNFQIFADLHYEFHKLKQF